MGTCEQMVEMYREGSLVWVQRKNGTWWPARIVGTNEISPTFKNHFECSLAFSKLPIMLLGMSSISVEWYNMDSKRVKPFRCGEFDHCIKEVESCEYSKCFNEESMSGDTGRYARREDAILHALAIEKKLKREGDSQPETVCRAKRLKSSRVLVKFQPSTVVKSPVRTDSSPILFEINTASPETLLHSSTSAESSGQCQSQSKPRSMTVEEHDQSMNWSKSPTCRTGGVTNQNEKQRQKGDRCNGGDALTNQKGCTLEKDQRVMADPLAPSGTTRGVKSSFVTQAAENTDISSIQSAHNAQQKRTEMMLADVDVTVEKVPRKEQVPIICMISKTSQKPIIGHPVDIEVLDDSSGIFLGKLNGDPKSLSGCAGAKVPKRRWRTAKRTPVCYTSTSEGPNSLVATQSFTDSKTKGRGHLHAPESAVNNLRKHTMRSDHSLIHAAENRASVNASGRVNYVPVKHIFSRLLAALGNQSSEQS